MRVSELNLAKKPHVETDQDARVIMYREFDRKYYIGKFGDIELIWDEEYQVYRAPALNAKREAYSRSKAVDCARWGCE